MAGGRRPLAPEILGHPTPVGEKSPIFFTDVHSYRLSRNT